MKRRGSRIWLLEGRSGEGGVRGADTRPLALPCLGWELSYPFFLGGGFLSGFVLGESECSGAIVGLSGFGVGAGVL